MNLFFVQYRDTVYGPEGNELEHAYISCPFANAKGTESDREWVALNVVPHLPSQYECNTPQELL